MELFIEYKKHEVLNNKKYLAIKLNFETKKGTLKEEVNGRLYKIFGRLKDFV